MGLTRWEPFSELRRMRNDMDRLFEGLTSPMMGGVEFMPAVDVYQKDNNIMVKADLPGLNKDDLEITATEDSICLKGEFKKEQEVKEEGFYRQERQMGKFFRTIPMPVGIKPDQVKASFHDGILEITAPKAEEAKSNEIKVSIE
ncbi:MAG: Hsp20/alpha crystallin family protein [Armatimonadota bacterium]